MPLALPCLARSSTSMACAAMASCSNTGVCVTWVVCKVCKAYDKGSICAVPCLVLCQIRTCVSALTRQALVSKHSTDTLAVHANTVAVSCRCGVDCRQNQQRRVLTQQLGRPWS